MPSPIPARILVVDDDFAMQRLLVKWLDADHYEVQTVGSASQALQLAQEAKPQLILTDWEMPLNTGLELCQELKQNPETSRCFCLIMTGRTSRNDLLAALESGADDFVRKPIDKGELLARVRYGLQRSGWQEAQPFEQPGSVLHTGGH